MRCVRSENEIKPTEGEPAEAVRAPDRRETGVEADRASEEALARLLAAAAREAHRVTEWEGAILADLHGCRRALSMPRLRSHQPA